MKNAYFEIGYGEGISNEEDLGLDDEHPDF